MKKSAVTRIKETHFKNERLAALGIEPMSLAALRSKVSLRRLAQPERVDFYMLLLVTAGHGKHTVDFVVWPLSPGTLIFVRPGQVQQWHPNDQLEAQLVLIAPSVLPHRSGLVLPREFESLAIDEWQTCIGLAEPKADEIGQGLWRLGQDFDLFDGSKVDVSLIRHELLTLLLRLSKLQRLESMLSGARRDIRVTYRLFIRELETGFPTQHSLQHYAKRLGYAESTLSRACLAAEGRTAKQVIDRRIALEAQRLLVHSTASVAEVGHHLGFSESTNFVKFFRRVIGVTPSVFRAKTVPPPRI